MQEEIFADAIGEIQVTNNVVRIDFVGLSPTEHDANSNPKTVFKQRIVMPSDAFANSADLIRRAVEGLGKPNPLRHQPARAESGAAGNIEGPRWDKGPVPSSTSTNDIKPSSPNFALAHTGE